MGAALAAIADARAARRSGATPASTETTAGARTRNTSRRPPSRRRSTTSEPQVPGHERRHRPAPAVEAVGAAPDPRAAADLGGQDGRHRRTLGPGDHVDPHGAPGARLDRLA